MEENKLEEIIDLLAKYGGFNREYLRDKLLTFANDGRLETKNKMTEVAAFQMAFPDTWEEFEKHYGFYDIKQAYTFGNTRLIPSFRVQQWLIHLDDINRKKKSQKNKMEQAATMNSFDKLLGRNGELVELRKEQMLAGAMHIIQQHYADKQNKMEAVAQMFGKKLFDKFHVKLGYDTFSARFSPYGFEIFGEHCMWVTDGQILNKLFIGKAVILD